MIVPARAAATLAVMALATVAAGARSGLAQADARYLVIPFDNADRQARLYWLSEGSAVLVTDDLIALGAAAITREDRLRAFESLNVPPVASLSHATVIRLGQLVGASHVVVGSFEEESGALQVRARAIRLDTGRMQPEIVEEGPLAEMLGIYARVARRLVPGSGAAVEEIEQGQPPLDAFEQYIKGVLAEAPATKLGYLEGALETYPRFQRARLAQWEVYTEQGEHTRAMGVALAVPADHPQARRARFLAATSLVNLGRHDQAFAALAELNRQKADAAVLNNLGIVQLRRKATSPSAVHYFSEASKLDADDPDLVFNLGYAYFAGGDPKAAAHWLLESVRRNPADDEAHYALGVALEAAGSHAEAAREKALARQLSSAWVDRETDLAKAMPRDLERMKTAIVEPGALRMKSVIVAFEQREQQELATFHVERGRRMFDEERDGEAIAELRRAIYLMPYRAEAHVLLARAYQRTGRTREAVDSLKIAVWIEPGNQAARELLEQLSQKP
ncbi:MAG: tetratricopeptide repeat protein [Vicinamibacterales bacterium]